MARLQISDKPTAAFYPKTANRKLAPVEMQANTTSRLRPVPVRPFVASTYVSLAATCPSGCVFKDNGCYVSSGFYAPVARFLDTNAAGVAPLAVIDEEASLIEMFARKHGKKGGIPRDGGKNGDAGRDLRLHVGGDTPDKSSAERLARAAVVWRLHGGGKVWTYTHNWLTIKRSAFGEIGVLASVESIADVARANKQGYAAAIVVANFPEGNRGEAYKVSRLKKEYTLIPCPAETSGASCTKCRLCFTPDALLARGAVIAFSAHGVGVAKVRDALEPKKVRRLTVIA